MPGDPGQEGEEVAPGLVGRDGVPGGEVGVVLALLGVVGVRQNALGQPPEPGAVLLGGCPQGLLVSLPVEGHDGVVLHGSLLSARDGP